MTKRRQFGCILSDDGRALLLAAQKKLGISQGAIIELALRKYAETERIEYRAPIAA